MIGDAEDRITAEGSVAGSWGSIVGIEGRWLVDLGAILGAQSPMFAEGEFSSDARDGSSAEGVDVGRGYRIGVYGREREHTGSGFDGGAEAAVARTLHGVGSGEFIDALSDGKRSGRIVSAGGGRS